ncbi:MAG: D-alanine--D-alanine ligase, partial [Gammaproteobacteria bacterium]
RVFIALHGSGGEDGALQGFLDSINLPYTGSNAAASLTGMDKKLSKLVWQAQGLPTPAWQMVADLHALEQAVQTLGLPLMVKPVSEGSSIGMSLLETHEQIASAWQLAAGQGQPVMTERYIQGDEYTAGLVAGETLPLIRITTANKFYDFEAKYQSDETGYHCPAGLDNDQEQSLRVLASEAFTAIGGSGWGRIDLMVDADRRPWLIEANTVPGLTDHSLLPMAAAATGWNFNQLALAILSTSMGQGETADGRRVFNG